MYYQCVLNLQGLCSTETVNIEKVNVSFSFFFLKIDVLEDPAIRNVIVLQTVLQEVRNRSAPVYKRIRDVTNNLEKHFYTFTNEHHR